ncbi:MAG: carboxypeptidase regulatory-like domain-containing protein [Fibrobacteres bacterium]|nr:carboxypeptidase regulatory-like domain-containing protein [Fibrobacterota bacterium]
MRARCALAGTGLALAVLLPSGCVSGGGTDVGNALVQGQVMDQGVAVSGAEVILMPAGYNPVMDSAAGATRTAFTDAYGEFRFTGKAMGAFTLEVLHPTEPRMDWIHPAHALAAGETLTVASELAAARTLAVYLPADAPPDAYAFLPGSDVYARREGAGETLRLPHVPAESLAVIAIGSLSSPTGMAYYPIAAGPADTAVDLRGVSPSPH